MSALAGLKYLSVSLPEDILHAREYGDFDLALTLIDRRIAGGTLPEALKKRLLLEREIVLQLPHEYTIPEEEAFEELKDGLGEFTREEFDRLILDHDLDWAYVNGQRHIHEDSIANLYKPSAAPTTGTNFTFSSRNHSSRFVSDTYELA